MFYLIISLSLPSDSRLMLDYVRVIYFRSIIIIIIVTVVRCRWSVGIHSVHVLSIRNQKQFTFLSSGQWITYYGWRLPPSLSLSSHTVVNMCCIQYRLRLVYAVILCDIMQI